MALIVETGAGLADAESYISVADADAYFAAHSDPSSWSGLTTAQKESALRYATTWLDRRYGWPGQVEFVETPQALAWPRSSAWDAEGRELEDVPQAVADATCEAALAHVASALNETVGLTGVGSLVESAQVGPLSVKFSESAIARRTFAYIDSILSLIASPRGMWSIETVRG